VGWSWGEGDISEAGIDEAKLGEHSFSEPFLPFGRFPEWMMILEENLPKGLVTSLRSQRHKVGDYRVQRCNMERLHLDYGLARRT